MLLSKVDIVQTKLTQLLNSSAHDKSDALALSPKRKKPKIKHKKVTIKTVLPAGNNDATNSVVDMDADVVCHTSSISAAKNSSDVVVDCDLSSQISNDSGTTKFSYATVARSNLHNNARNGAIQDNKQEKNLVEGPKKIIYGTKTDADLAVVDTNKKWWDLSSFSPSQSADSIINYISSNGSINKEYISCYKLVKKDETNVRSRVNFKLGVPFCYADLRSKFVAC